MVRRNRGFLLWLLGLCLGLLIILLIALWIEPAAWPWVLLTGVLLIGAFVLFTLKRYRAIAQLNLQINERLHDRGDPYFKQFQEGELAILQNELAKLSVRLTSQSDRLLAEKRALADALTDISHQLRTPLTALSLGNHRLAREALTPTQRRQLIRNQERLIERIDWLVEALLKLSKLDAGTIQFQPRQITCADLLERVISGFAITLELKEQTLVVSGDTESLVTLDPVWTAEALSNVLKNCIESTPVGGRLSIDCEVTALYDRFIVSDNGPGLDPEDLPHLFERFYKGRHAGPNSIGIGLALARSICAAQNGTLKAENHPAGGARFVFSFYHQVI